MNVLLHDDVAAAGVGRILVADQRGLDGLLALRVLGAVDEAHHAAGIQVPEAMDLVHRHDGVAQLFADAHGQFEAGVGARGADVQQQVPGCGRGGVFGTLEGFHGVQPLGQGVVGEEPGPGVVADADHAAEVGAGQAQVQGAQHGRHFAQGVARGVGGFVAVSQGQHDEDGGHAGRLHDRLRVGGGTGGLDVFVHGKDAFQERW